MIRRENKINRRKIMSWIEWVEPISIWYVNNTLTWFCFGWNAQKRHLSTFGNFETTSWIFEIGKRCNILQNY